MSTTADLAEPERNVVAQAAEWHVRLNADDASDAERRACEQWRAAHPAHGLALARMAELWQRLERARDLPRAAAVRALAQKARKNRKRDLTRATLLGMMLVATIFAVADAEIPALSWALADYRTRVGEQRTITLIEGSRIVLNTDSAIDISFDATQRRVRLRRGEIMISVSKDSARPFVVETPQGTARALGTQYVVRRNGDATEVTVIESVVRACPAATGGASCVDLNAGQRTRIRPNGVNRAQAVDAATQSSWTQGVLLIDDRPLAEVLRELERHRPGWIGFDEDALRHLRVSGVFPLDDTDRALAVLAATQPISLRLYGTLYVKVNAR